MGRHRHHGENKLLISIVLNIFITTLQVIGGFVSGSLALLSDALRNFTDVLSLIISYFAQKLTKRKATLRRTFGYKRAEILAAFINALSLIVIALFLTIEAVERLQQQPVIDSDLVITLSIFAIIGNGISVILLKKESKGNINIKSAYIHLLSDMMASVAVFIGGLLMKYFGMFWVDGVLTIIIAIYLIIISLHVLKKSTEILMLFTPSNIPVEEITPRLLQRFKEIKNIHHLHVWQINETELHLEAHVDFRENISLSTFHQTLQKIEKYLKNNYQINHTNIQPEFGRCGEKELIIQD